MLLLQMESSFSNKIRPRFLSNVSVTSTKASSQSITYHLWEHISHDNTSWPKRMTSKTKTCQSTHAIKKELALSILIEKKRGVEGQGQRDNTRKRHLRTWFRACETYWTIGRTQQHRNQSIFSINSNMSSQTFQHETKVKGQKCFGLTHQWIWLGLSLKTRK